jgi:hypothetical protein
VPASAARRLLVALLVVCALVPALPAAPAVAREGGDRAEVRERGVCGRGSEARLRLRADDGRIRVDTEIRTGRTGVWRVTILHERRIVLRARVRVTRSSGGLRHRAVLPDYAGADQVSVRAVAPSGESCAVAAVLGGDSSGRS